MAVTSTPLPKRADCIGSSSRRQRGSVWRLLRHKAQLTTKHLSVRSVAGDGFELLASGYPRTVGAAINRPRRIANPRIDSTARDNSAMRQTTLKSQRRMRAQPNTPCVDKATEHEARHLLLGPNLGLDRGMRGDAVADRVWPGHLGTIPEAPNMF